MFRIYLKINSGTSLAPVRFHHGGETARYYGSSIPYQRKGRTKLFMNAEECEQRAAELFASACKMNAEIARLKLTKEACEFRELAELKRMVQPEIEIGRS